MWKSVSVGVSLLVLAGCGPTNPRELIGESPENLSKMLRTGDVQAKRNAAFTLTALARDPDKPHSAADALRGALAEPDPVTRIFAAHALARLGENSPELRAAFDRAFHDREPWYRLQACYGVGFNPELLQASLAPLSAALEESDVGVLQAATCSLARAAVIPDRVTIDRLIRIARTHHEWFLIQEYAIQALGKADRPHILHATDALRLMTLHRSHLGDNTAVRDAAIADLESRLPK